MSELLSQDEIDNLIAQLFQEMETPKEEEPTEESWFTGFCLSV